MCINLLAEGCTGDGWLPTAMRVMISRRLNNGPELIVRKVSAATNASIRRRDPGGKRKGPLGRKVMWYSCTFRLLNIFLCSNRHHHFCDARLRFHNIVSLPEAISWNYEFNREEGSAEQRLEKNFQMNFRHVWRAYSRPWTAYRKIACM